MGTGSSMTRLAMMEQLGAYGFVLPAFLFIFAFMLYPMVYTFYLSFTKFDFVYDTRPAFIGLRNYLDFFSDPVFIDSFWNTVRFTIAFFPALFILSLAVAVALNTEIPGHAVYRTLVFLPTIVPLSISGVMFSWMYSENFGLVNHVLRYVLRLPQYARDWLTDMRTVTNALVVVQLWKYVGIVVILFLAGLEAIERDLYDAAKVDGANAWQTFFCVVFPNLKESLLIASVYGILQAVKVFQLPFVMTEGGPGTATLSLYLYLWRNAFLFFKMGYASAIAYFVSAIIVVLSAILFRVVRTEKA